MALMILLGIPILLALIWVIVTAPPPEYIEWDLSHLEDDE